VKRVRYEDLVLRPKDTIKQIVKFLGIDFEEHMLNWDKTGRVKNHSALFGEAEPVHSRSVGRWKNSKYEKRIKEFMSREDVKKLLSQLNYI